MKTAVMMGNLSECHPHQPRSHPTVSPAMMALSLPHLNEPALSIVDSSVCRLPPINCSLLFCLCSMIQRRHMIRRCRLARSFGFCHALAQLEKAAHVIYISCELPDSRKLRREAHMQPWSWTGRSVLHQMTRRHDLPHHVALRYRRHPRGEWRRCCHEQRCKRRQ